MQRAVFPQISQGNSPKVSYRNKPWTVTGAGQSRPASAPAPAVALNRRYDVQWMDDDGEIDSFVKVAPALPIFEEAFSAFAHGAVISTALGPVAVEDLMPGMEVETASGSATLRWVGAITLIPGKPGAFGEDQKLYRTTADAFGLGRPSTDVTFGPAARLLNRDPAIRQAMGSEAALTRIASYEDGMGVVGLTPVSPVRVYHLALDSHQVIRAGGLEVESYHPGSEAHYSMSTEMRGVFMSLFPHLAGLQDFGQVVCPRYELGEEGDYAIV